MYVAAGEPPALRRAKFTESIQLEDHMKLAEALILRADYQKKIEQLKQRLIRNAKVQEGDKPAEDPKPLLEEVERISRDLMSLIQRINKTNSATTLKKGTTVSDAIATRDVLLVRQAIYRDLATAATITQDRYSKSEVKFRSTIGVKEIQKKADDLSKEYRDLDARIQHSNWQTDLLE